MSEEKQSHDNDITDQENTELEKQKQAYDMVSDALGEKTDPKDINIDESVLDEILIQREAEEAKQNQNDLPDDSDKSNSSVLSEWQKIDEQESKKQNKGFVWEPQPGQNYLSFSLICGGASILFLYMDYGFIFSLICAVGGLILTDTARKKGYKGQIRMISLVVSILVLVYDTASLALLLLT